MATYTVQLTVDQIRVLDCILNGDLNNAKQQYREYLDVSDYDDKVRAFTNRFFTTQTDFMREQVCELLDRIDLEPND